MHPNLRGVDHLQVAIMRLRYRGEYAVSDTDFSPTAKAVGTGDWRSVSLRNVSPRRPCSKPPVDSVRHLAVVCACNASQLIGEER
jgi:hypothetical protein